MNDFKSDNGMAELIVDEQKVSTVYYEFWRRMFGAHIWKSGILSGDPMDLQRASEEGPAKLAVEGGQMLPVRITNVVHERGSANFNIVMETQTTSVA